MSRDRADFPMAGLILALTMLVGCAERPRPFAAIVSIPHLSAEAYHLYSVPYYPHRGDLGGPSTLASVLTYWGFRTEPPVLQEEIHRSRHDGALAPDMLPADLMLAAQARGLRAQSYSGTVENLKAELKAGHPLMALIDLGRSAGARLSSGGDRDHRYVVIVGFDDVRQGVYIHSEEQPDTFVPYSRFLQEWERTGRWVLLILPPAMQGRNRI